MTPDVVGICVAILGSVLIGSIAIAVAVFFGLRSTVNPLGDKLSALKDDLILELSNIKERIIKIEGVADSIWQYTNAYLQQREGIGTITRDLKNFGKTKISANPFSNFTQYTIKFEIGRLSSGSIEKISKKTNMEEEEKRLFSGQPVHAQAVGSTSLILQVPSTDPKLCTTYISTFLKWLDTEYIAQMQLELKKFEDDITV